MYTSKRSTLIFYYIIKQFPYFVEITSKILFSYKRNFVHERKLRFSAGVQNLECSNVEQLIFRNFKITNIKIAKDELFDYFIYEFIFSLLINYLHNLIIFQIEKY